MSTKVFRNRAAHCGRGIGRRHLRAVDSGCDDPLVLYIYARTSQAQFEPGPAEIETIAKKWHPYRSVASWYLWRSLELQD